MITRAATAADVPALTELQARFDEHWFGACEHDETEIREGFEMVDSPGDHSLLLFDDNRLAAAAMRTRTETSLTVDPRADVAAVLAVALDWLARHRVPELECLDRDEQLRDALTERGWHYRHSAFDLRATPSAMDLSVPVWADGVRLRDFRDTDAAGVHELIYGRARWSSVPGHNDRGVEEWRRIFLDRRAPAEAPVVAWRADRIVGVSLSRTFSDGVGWIAQLAVDPDERGKGLGRSLVIETFRRRLAAGATSLGLGVMGANRTALRLYLDLGLTVEREWQSWAPPEQ